MLNLNLLFVVCLAIIGAYFIILAIQIREHAQKAVEARCQRENVQLLDGSIFLRRIAVGRDKAGRFRFKREFQFEFTATGAERNRGFVRLLGQQITNIELSPHRFQ